jgi:hypothetical protein
MGGDEGGWKCLIWRTKNESNGRKNFFEGAAYFEHCTFENPDEDPKGGYKIL